MKTSFRGFGKRTLSAVLAMLSLLSLCVVGITSASAAETEIAELQNGLDGANIYFDNSSKNFTNPQFLCGRQQYENDYTSGYAMTQISNTKIWYKSNLSWDSGDQTFHYSFIDSSSTWGAENKDCNTRITAAGLTTSQYTTIQHTTNWYASGTNLYASSGNSYVLTSTSSVTGTFNHTFTFKAAYNGAENYDAGTVSVSGYKLSSGTASQQVTANATTASASAVLAKTTTATLTATPKAGYMFKGWYTNINGTGTALSEKKTYNLAVGGTGTTYYAVFVPVKLYVTGPANPSNTTWGSWTQVTTTEDGIKYIALTCGQSFKVSNTNAYGGYDGLTIDNDLGNNVTINGDLGDGNLSTGGSGTFYLCMNSEGKIYATTSKPGTHYYYSYYNASENLYFEMTKSENIEGSYIFSIPKNMISGSNDRYLNNYYKFKITNSDADGSCDKPANCVNKNSPTCSVGNALISVNVGIQLNNDSWNDFQLTGDYLSNLQGNTDLVILYTPSSATGNPTGAVTVYTADEYNGTAGTVTINVPSVAGVQTVSVNGVTSGSTTVDVYGSFPVVATAAEGYTVTSMKYGTQTITGASGTFIAKKDVTTITINVTANSGATGTVTVYFKSAESLGYVPKFTVGNSNTVNTMTVNGAVIGNNTTNSGYYYWYSASVSFSGPLTLHFSNGYALNADYTISAPVSGNSYYLGVDNLNCGTKIYDMTSWAENKRNWCESAVHMIFGTKAGEKDENLAAVSAELSLVTIGDANLDGKVNVKDATFIQKVVAGIVTLDEVGMVAADVDMSGAITVKDATAVQKQLAALL